LHTTKYKNSKQNKKNKLNNFKITEIAPKSIWNYREGLLHHRNSGSASPPRATQLAARGFKRRLLRVVLGEEEERRLGFYERGPAAGLLGLLSGLVGL
jgi:hypothetical protein